MNFIDKAIKAISPERALKREVAKKRLSMINSGYGNYGDMPNCHATVANCSVLDARRR